MQVTDSVHLYRVNGRRKVVARGSQAGGQQPVDNPREPRESAAVPLTAPMAAQGRKSSVSVRDSRAFRELNRGGCYVGSAKPAIPRLAQVLKDEEVEYLKNEAEPLVQIAEALENAGDSQTLPTLKDALRVMEGKQVSQELVHRMQDAVSSLTARQQTRAVRTN